MAQNLIKHSGASRELSLNNPQHRTLIIMTAVVGAAYFASQLSAGESLFDAVLSAINISGSAFLAWVITREFDPDRPDSALAAAALAAVGVLLLDSTTNLVAVGALIMAARAVARTTGLYFKLGDVIFAVLLVGLTARTDQWVVGLVVGLGFWLDGVAEKPSRYARINAVIVIVMTLAIAYLSEVIDWSFIFTNADYAALITAFVAARFVVPSVPDPPKSVGDFTGEPLDRRRVMYCLTLMALALILVSWSGDDDTTFGILPLWAGLISVILYQARDRVYEMQQEENA